MKTVQDRNLSGSNIRNHLGDEERHYVYLVRCADDSLYCGWTTDLKRRIDAHNGHISGGAKYTRGRRPVTLVYAESFHQKQDMVCLTNQEHIKPMTRPLVKSCCHNA